MDILIIDTNKTLCAMFSGVLEEEGHAVTCAHAGKEGLAAAAERRPDLILLELAMPDMSGLAMIRRLERQPETRDVPVIVVSADPELEDEVINVFDFIPKPVDIGRLKEDIASIGQGGKRRPSKGTELAERDYRLFAGYLLTHTGLHFEQRNIKLLERGLLNRMAALKIDSFRVYYDYLVRYGERRQELGKLLQFLTVGETYFFRYHAHFEALQRLIIPSLVEQRRLQGEKRLRFWSAGCSTGEEPYSLAMTIMETLPEWREWDIQILATDINNRSLRRAREGVYSGRALRVIDRKYLERYFRVEGKSYIVRNNVKGLVKFAHLNLQASAFPVCAEDGGCFDVIFCRNVMIYFNLPTTREIVSKFAQCLYPGGHLFLGHSETLLQISDDFEREAECGGFYYRKRGGGPEDETKGGETRKPAGPHLFKPRLAKPGRPEKIGRREEPLPIVPAPEPLAKGAAEKSPEELFRLAVGHFDAEEYAAAAAILHKIAALTPGHTGALVMHGFIQANQGHFEEALATCRQALTLDDLLPAAYFLRGLILELTAQEALAATEYRKAVLLDMGFVMPHYQLGKLLFRLGKAKEGGRELRNCLRILEKSGEGSIIPYSGGLSREVFLELIRGELAGPLKQ